MSERGPIHRGPGAVALSCARLRLGLLRVQSLISQVRASSEAAGSKSSGGDKRDDPLGPCSFQAFAPSRGVGRRTPCSFARLVYRSRSHVAPPSPRRDPRPPPNPRPCKARPQKETATSHGPEPRSQPCFCFFFLMCAGERRERAGRSAPSEGRRVWKEREDRQERSPPTLPAPRM